jgi:hypothetical protein
MPITYRLVDSQAETLAHADSIQYLKGLVRDLGPGRYTVDKIHDEPGPSGHPSRRWGAIRKLDDGTIILEPDPQEG